jgi:aryl-alcohol dehydrogenase-like predicted oxidoreductase
MRHRCLGNTGLKVAEIGLGCNRLGEDHRPAAYWDDLVRLALDLGVDLFDTSEIYQHGGSEEVLGRVIGQRADICIATKGHPADADGNRHFAAAAVMAAAEGSLRRLQRDVIDIYQLHSPSREQLEHSNWSDALDALRAQGKIRFRAVAVRTAEDGVWLMEQGLVEVLQITHNLIDTSAAGRLLPLAAERGVGLLCRLPLAQGVLSGKFSPDRVVPPGHRVHTSGPQRMAAWIHKAEDLRPVATGYPGGMARMAHHFSLMPDAVSAIIPGARTPQQLRDNVAAAGGILPADLLTRITAVQANWEQQHVCPPQGASGQA